MSHEGKMRRGQFYQNKSNLAENIKSDVAYFYEQTKPAEPVEVKKVKEKKKVVQDASN